MVYNHVYSRSHVNCNSYYRHRIPSINLIPIAYVIMAIGVIKVLPILYYGVKGLYLDFKFAKEIK